MRVFCLRSIICLIGFLACIGYSLPAFAQYNRYPANNNTSSLQQNNGTNNAGSPNNTFSSPFNNQQTGRQRASLRGRGNTTVSDGQSDDASNLGRNSRSRRPPRALGSTPGQGTPQDALVQPNLSLPNNANEAAGGQGGGPVLAPSGNRVIRNVPEIKIRKNATLYLNTPSTFAILHQPIAVDVVLSDKTKAEYDRLSFLIQYDPKDLMLTSGQDANGEWSKPTAIAIASATASTKKENAFLAEDASTFSITQNVVDSENGLIFLDMESIKGPVSVDGDIVQLTFLPLRETRTSISFLYVNPIQRDSSKEPLTRLMLKELDQLGTHFSQADGALDLELPVFASLEQAERQPIVTKAGERSGEKEEGSITLALVPRQSEINVGDIMNVDVVLSNPDKKSFDSVYLLMAYNPRVFEPVDADDRASGVNIADREYGEKFALDFPILNVIDKDRGIIDYRKKAMGRPVREEGTLATIQLRAIRPTKKSTFRLFINDTGKEPTTGLFYRYQDRLGNESDPFDGVSTCSIGVRATTAFLKKLSE